MPKLKNKINFRGFNEILYILLYSVFYGHSFMTKNSWIYFLLSHQIYHLLMTIMWEKSYDGFLKQCEDLRIIFQGVSLWVTNVPKSRFILKFTEKRWWNCTQSSWHTNWLTNIVFIYKLMINANNELFVFSTAIIVSILNLLDN